MAGISQITGTSINTEFKWTAGMTQTGAAYNPMTSTGDIRKAYSFGTSVANSASGGGDEVFSFQQGIVAGGSATINLQGLTDIVQRAAASIVRIKGYQIRLLSAADDATLSPAPNANSTVLVTNNGPAVPAPLDFGNGGSGLTLTLTTGATVVTGVAIGAAGSGYPPTAEFVVSPQQVGGSGALISVVTNGSGVPTSVAILASGGGTGYTNGTVPSVVVGQYLIVTGGVHCYFDPTAGGFCSLSSTAKNISVVNLDASNAVTIEVDIFGAST